MLRTIRPFSWPWPLAVCCAEAETGRFGSYQEFVVEAVSESPPEGNSRRRVSWKKVIKWSLRLIILLAVVWGIWNFVGDAWSDLRKQGFAWRELNWFWLVVAGLCYGVGLAPSCWFWQRILFAMGQRPGLIETARAYYIGHLGKYVPGKALVVVIRTSLIRGSRVDTTVAATSVFIETLTMMAVGACLSAVVLIFASRDWPLMALSVGLMCAAGIPTWPPLFRWIVRKLQVQRANPEIEKALDGINGRVMVQGWLSMTVGWCLLGVSMWAIIQAIPEVSGSWQETLWDLPLLTGCVALALVAGFLSLLPGGIFVREFVVMTVIADYLEYGELVAIASAVLLRLVWLMSELVVSAILYTCGRGSSGEAG